MLLLLTLFLCCSSFQRTHSEFNLKTFLFKATNKNLGYFLSKEAIGAAIPELERRSTKFKDVVRMT